MKYNIPKNTINDWFRDIDKYKNAIKTGKKITIIAYIYSLDEKL